MLEVGSSEVVVVDVELLDEVVSELVVLVLDVVEVSEVEFVEVPVDV